MFTASRLQGNGKQSLKDKNRFFEIARGSSLTIAATMLFVGAMGVCLFATAFATVYIGDIAGLWEVAY
jgi:hypothetical protein